MTNGKIDKLISLVRGVYEERNPNRADWSDWLYSNHVFLVADAARDLAIRFGANADLAQAAGMLHDVADAVMSRFDKGHSVKSEDMARHLLAAADFDETEIAIIVDDAIRLHGCHDGLKPSSLEGKIMATADAVVHLESDFYPSRIMSLRQTGKTPEEIAGWATPKIERDFNAKICFDEIREECRSSYERQLQLLEGLKG